jgi:hypothetical protein
MECLHPLLDVLLVLTGNKQVSLGIVLVEDYFKAELAALFLLFLFVQWVNNVVI